VKILLLNTIYPPTRGSAGAERAISLLANSLVRRNHEVVVVALHESKTESIEFRDGVKIYRLPLDNIYWPLAGKRRSWWLRFFWHFNEIWNRRAASRVGRILDLEKPDVVNTHNVSGFSVSIWTEVKRRGIRLVHTAHDYYLLCQRRTLFRSNKICTSRCFTCRVAATNKVTALKNVDTFCAVSEKSMTLHEQLIAASGCSKTVLFNICPKMDLLRQESRSDDHLVLGYIGAIEEKKGLEILLSALERVSQSNWSLTIAGSGISACIRDLKRRYPDPRIEWRGQIPREEFYSAVDVVIIPSLWHEPLPYVCIEALSTRKAVICTDVGGIPEIAKVSSGAILVPAGDSRRLAAALDNILADPHSCTIPFPLDEEAYSQFSEESVIRKYLDVYHHRETGPKKHSARVERPD
jgi:glycosyltransferase involved in cell wall biosynthesis